MPIPHIRERTWTLPCPISLNFGRIIAEQTPSIIKMSSPHPPTSATGAVEQIEPAWNPGGKSLSYINKTGRRKFGVIGVLLSFSPSLNSSPTFPKFDFPICDASVFVGAIMYWHLALYWSAYFSCDADYELCVGDLASLSTAMEKGFD